MDTRIKAKDAKVGMVVTDKRGINMVVISKTANEINVTKQFATSQFSIPFYKCVNGNMEQQYVDVVV